MAIQLQFISNDIVIPEAYLKASVISVSDIITYVLEVFANQESRVNNINKLCSIPGTCLNTGDTDKERVVYEFIKKNDTRIANSIDV